MVEPGLAGAGVLEGPLPEAEPVSLAPLPPENFKVDPSAIIPGEGEETITLSPENRHQLEQELGDILDAHDQAVTERVKRWASINDAYNLVHDPSTTGQMPNASQLVSEMVRSHTNIATARLVEGIMGLEQVLQVKVASDQSDDERTEELIAEAKAMQNFLNPYILNRMRGRRWIKAAIHRACKLGAGVVRFMWKTQKTRYWYRDKSGKPKKKETERGRVSAELVHNWQMVYWPLEGLSSREGENVVGHRAFYTPSSFRQFAKRIEMEAGEIEAMLTANQGASDGDEHIRPSHSDMAGKDIHLDGLNPYKSEIKISELWLQDYVLPGTDEPGCYQCFYYDQDKKLLWVGVNPLRCQNHPYFLFPYWNEDNSIWPSGVGQELLFAQKADSSLWNMLIDNLKVVGNVLRILKADSMAASLQDQIGPGYNLITDDINEDIRTENLGSDLSQIHQAISANDMRGAKASGINLPTQGFADPVLKSGASPGSISQLNEQSGKKFGEVDRDQRQTFSEVGAFIMELVQQYAPDDLLYEMTSQGDADLIRQMKYRAPDGDLRSTFRITAAAPSATSNRETLKQNLLISYKLASDHLPTFFGLVDQVVAPVNPAGAEKLKIDMVTFLQNDLFKQGIEAQDIPGLSAKVPQVEDPNPEQMIYNQMLQQAYAQVDELTQQLMMFTGGAEGGGQPPMGPAPQTA